MTTIYLMRHSEPFKPHKGLEEVNESILVANVKSPLSIYGEKLAERISNNAEFEDLDVVWASDYVRSMSTAKYFAFRNELKVNISALLGERKHGVHAWDELPANFEQMQLQEEDYKINDGESKKEVISRLKCILNRFLHEYKEKRILIVGHATAITFLLSEWCEISYDGPYKFKGNEFFDGKWEYCTTFKLVIDDNNELIDIKQLKF